MYDLRALSIFKLRLFVFVVFAWAVFNFSVIAADIPAQSGGLFNYVSYNTVGPGQQRINYSNVGSGLGDAGASSITSQGRALVVSRAGTVVNPSGVPVPVVVRGTLPLAKAAPLITKAMKLVPVLGQGIAYYELAKELGFNPFVIGGDISVTKKDPTLCTVAPCGQYKAFNSPWLYNADAACQYIYRMYPGAYDFVHAANNQCWGKTFGLGGAEYIVGPLYTQSADPQPDVPIPSTLQELEDAIATSSGWPDHSHISQAVADSITATRETPQVEAPSVTGPPTSTGGVRETTNPDGSRSVQTDSYKHTYSGPDITTEKTTTVVNYNTDNSVNNTTTTVSSPAPDSKTDCDKKPDSNGCRTDDFDTPDDKIPKVDKPMTLKTENLGFGGGSCPADVYINAGGMRLKALDWAYSCNLITTFLKPLVLVLAAFGAAMVLFGKGIEA